MKYDEAMVSVFAMLMIVVVVVVGMVCMALESTATTTEAIKAGLVQDANGRWVKP